MYQATEKRAYKVISLDTVIKERKPQATAVLIQLSQGNIRDPVNRRLLQLPSHDETSLSLLL